MKQTTKIIGFLLLAFCLTCPAWGRGTANVANTIHNLSTSAPYIFYETNVDEVCVFCHTPHGGLLEGPLWNHSLTSNTGFTHYNSATLSQYLRDEDASRVVNDESLLCLGCHDGSIGVQHIINEPNTLNGAPIIFTGFPPSVDGEIVDMFGGVGARIGASLSNTAGTGDLSDDHPISFSYDSVLADPMYSGGSKTGELRPVATAVNWQGEGVRFFGTTNRVECSSCHDPHVDYETDTDYRPFLIRPNSGSNLCLACHNK